MTPADQSVSRAKPRDTARSTPAAGSVSEAAATYTTQAISASATTKCAVTHHGSSSVATTFAAEHGLAEHERERGDRGPEDPRLVPAVEPGQDPQPQRQADHQEREGPVGELDQRVHRAAREELPGIALRPGRAAEPRSGAAHEAADREEHDRDDGGGDGELLEAGAHGGRLMISAERGPGRPDWDTARMTTASKAEIAASLADLRDRVDAVLDAVPRGRRGRARRTWTRRPRRSSTRSVVCSPPAASACDPRSATGATGRRAAATGRRSCGPRPRSSSSTRWRSCTTT